MARDRPSVTLEQLEKAVSRLRSIEREVLVLGAREQLSNGQIAAHFGITVKAAEPLLASAICRLDRALERQERPLVEVLEGLR